MTVTHDLRGRTDTEWREDGVTFHLSFDPGDREA